MIYYYYYYYFLEAILLDTIYETKYDGLVYATF